MEERQWSTGYAPFDGSRSIWLCSACWVPRPSAASARSTRSSIRRVSVTSRCRRRTCHRTDEAELDTLEYTRVAIIEATGSGEFTDQTDMLEAMRERAGKIGANAILLPQINEPGAGAKVAAAVFGTGTQRKGNVVALRILGPKKKAPTGLAALWARATGGIRNLLE